MLSSNLFFSNNIPFTSFSVSHLKIVYFFVLAGTLQAIITPDPDGGFPNYGFFKYWFVHCGLVLVVICLPLIYIRRLEVYCVPLCG